MSVLLGSTNLDAEAPSAPALRICIVARKDLTCAARCSTAARRTTTTRCSPPSSWPSSRARSFFYDAVEITEHRQGDLFILARLRHRHERRREARIIRSAWAVIMGGREAGKVK